MEKSTITDRFGGSSGMKCDKFKCSSSLQPFKVKLKLFVKWSVLVISNCAIKLVPSDVSMRMFEIFTDDEATSRTSLCKNGNSISSFHAVNETVRSFSNISDQINSLGELSSFKFRQIWSSLSLDGHFVIASTCLGMRPELCSLITDCLIFDVESTGDGQIDCLMMSVETGIVWFSSVIKPPSNVSFTGTSRDVRFTSRKLLKLSRDVKLTWKLPFVKVSGKLLKLENFKWKFYALLSVASRSHTLFPVGYETTFRDACGKLEFLSSDFELVLTKRKQKTCKHEKY